MIDGHYHQTNDSSLTARSFCEIHIGQHQVHILASLPLWVSCEYPVLYFYNMALTRPLQPSLKIQLFSVFLITGESELRKMRQRAQGGKPKP